jgi:signal transduction histidine kinase
MISHKIAKEFGGTLNVSSIPQKGSVFTFEIPLRNEEEIQKEKD